MSAENKLFLLCIAQEEKKASAAKALSERNIKINFICFVRFSIHYGSEFITSDVILFCQMCFIIFQVDIVAEK